MPKIVDHEARKAEIMDHSFGLFATQGYAALSMRGIAKALGVTTGTLYYYFESKEDLFEATVRRMAMQNAAEATADAPEGASPSERLASLLGFVQQNAVPLLQTLQVSMEYQRQRGAQKAHVWNRATMAVYREALREQLNLTEAQSTVAFGLLIGVVVQLHLDPETVDVSAHLDVLEQMLHQ